MAVPKSAKEPYPTVMRKLSIPGTIGPWRDGLRTLVHGRAHISTNRHFWARLRTQKLKARQSKPGRTHRSPIRPP